MANLPRFIVNISRWDCWLLSGWKNADGARPGRGEKWVGTYLWPLRSRSPESSSWEGHSKTRGLQDTRDCEGRGRRPPYFFRTREPWEIGSACTPKPGGARSALPKCAAPRGSLVPRLRRREGGLRSLWRRKGRKLGGVRWGREILAGSWFPSWIIFLCVLSAGNTLPKAPDINAIGGHRPWASSKPCAFQGRSKLWGPQSFSVRGVGGPRPPPSASLFGMFWFHGSYGRKWQMPSISTCPTKGDLVWAKEGRHTKRLFFLEHRTRRKPGTWGRWKELSAKWIWPLQGNS